MVLSVNTMFQWKECLKRVQCEREVAKTNGANEGPRTVVFMKEEACTLVV